MKLEVEDIVEWLKKNPVKPEEYEEWESKPVTSLVERAQFLKSTITAQILKFNAECELISIDDFPDYVPEEINRNILIKGRWLERGGSAWWISTAGTGKSIASIQLAFYMTAGLPFAGLTPNTIDGKGLKFWIIQSEDSPSRITIDREDITAELTELYPDVDWREVRKAVKFLKIGGKTGAAFLTKLAEILGIAKARNELPDIIIINPFLAYIGGPVTDGSYVTPFLRGGEINGEKTNGLQYILETYNIAAIIFHHTPKPPAENEIEKWMKATFPEYQGAGSSDITNWGRSFITMMRVKGETGIVCLTAGKNGGELGWENIDGATRRYMAWSSGKGISGKVRHAWRDLTAEEYERVTKCMKMTASANVQIIVDALKKQPMTAMEIERKMKDKHMSRQLFRTAWKEVSSNYKNYNLTCIEAKNGRAKVWFFGEYEAAKQAAIEYETEEDLNSDEWLSDN